MESVQVTLGPQMEMGHDHEHGGEHQ
jgi:hypothetical protein